MQTKTKTYLSVKEITARYGVGNTTVYDWLKTTDFPKPYRIGRKLSRWKLSELEEWEEKNKGGAA